MLKKLADFLPFVVALLAFMVILPWTLGVPGTRDGDYARGWTLGYYALLLYPAACLVLGFLRRLARRRAVLVSPAHVTGVIWLALAAFVTAQVIAWRLILQA